MFAIFKAQLLAFVDRTTSIFFILAQYFFYISNKFEGLRRKFGKKMRKASKMKLAYLRVKSFN